ncbi:MAG: TonB-dependent receptor, partial [Halioglobus sp.]|nr:TonB-dependent receptor [Halioglobus sp.]
GTLYGKNTNAGAISVVTRSPNADEFEGYVEASAGNYAMRRLTGSASGPITDTLAYRLSGNTHQRDGFYDNRVGDDLNDADDWNIMGKLQWQPTEALSLLLSGSHVDRDTRCCGADAIQSDAVNDALAARGLQRDKNDPYDYQVAPDVASRFAMESDLLSLSVDYELDNATVTAITAWNDYSYSVDTDPDRSQLDVLALLDDDFAGDSFSQELRFTADLGDSIEYQVGLFYYEQTTRRGDNQPFVIIGEDFIEIASQQTLPFPPGITVDFIAAPGDYLVARFEQDSETLAAFGQATWHIGERWHLTGGLRWTDERKEVDLFSETVSSAPSASILGSSFLDSVSTPIDTTLDRNADNVDWLLRLAMDIGMDSMLFASASTGTKSGGFNSVSGAADTREFDDEETLSYELGIKSTLLDARFRVNATLFFTQIDNFQSQQQNPTGIGTFVSNEAEVESSGLDVYIEALPLPNLTLSAGLQYLDKYAITAGPAEGQALPFTAEVSGNLAATLVFPLANGGVYWRTDYSYMDDHSTNVADAAQLNPSDFDDRNLVNSKLGWRNEHWNISVWGRNLTDDEYASQTAVTQLASGTDAYFLAEPRTWGASLRYDF